MKTSKGFTLIELLVVIVIVAILSAVVLIAVNPGKQLAAARNSERWAEVNASLNAFTQYQVDHEGRIPTACEVTTPGTSTSCGTDLVSDGYIAAIPAEPSGGPGTCGYTVTCVATTTPPYRVTIAAGCPEDAMTISVTR